MAKKLASGEKSKSEIVREFLKDKGNASLSTPEVIEAVGKTGVSVSQPLVAMIRSELGLTKKRGGKKTKKATAPKKVSSKMAAPSSNGSAGFGATIRQASDFVKAAGGVQEAIDLLKSLEAFGK